MSMLLKRLLCCLWLAGLPVVATAELGRLFTTPQERTKLEAVRNQPIPPPKLEPIAAEEPILIAPVLPDKIRLKGFVLRADGKNVAWINDDNTLTASPVISHIKINPKDISADGVEMTLPLPNGNLGLEDKMVKIKLKVGEHFTPHTEPTINPDSPQEAVGIDDLQQ